MIFIHTDNPDQGSFCLALWETSPLRASHRIPALLLTMSSNVTHLEWYHNLEGQLQTLPHLMSVI